MKKKDIKKLSNINRTFHHTITKQIVEKYRDTECIVMEDLDRCKENYNMLRKLIVQNKRIIIFGLKITDLYLNIKDKFRNIFRVRKYR